MRLINMQRPKPKKDEERLSKPEASDSYYEKWPWGLRIRLRQDELEKLKVDVSKFSANQKVAIHAMCFVSEIETSQSVDDKGKTKDDNCMELQITDMEIINSNDFESAFEEATAKNG